MAWRCFPRSGSPRAAEAMAPLLALACLVVLPGPWAHPSGALAAETGATEAGGTPQLECRLQAGPWQRCRMEVEQLGSRWWLVVGDQRIEFRHDGRGSVRMQRQGGAWQPVTARWAEDTSLCWDGVCARGDLPLD